MGLNALPASRIDDIFYPIQQKCPSSRRTVSKKKWERIIVSSRNEGVYSLQNVTLHILLVLDRRDATQGTDLYFPSAILSLSRKETSGRTLNTLKHPSNLFL